MQIALIIISVISLILLISFIWSIVLLFKKNKNFDSNSITELTNVLKRTNNIGKFGEFYLERILNNISNNSKVFYQRQYKMKKIFNKENVIVDCFIFGKDKYFNIPIDSKFPYESYKESVEESNNKSEKLKIFQKNMKNHIKDITNKYVSVEDNAYFAILFIYSDQIFDYLQIKKNQEIIDYAFQNNVIITGPSILFALLLSLEFYLKKIDNLENYDEKIMNLNLIENEINEMDKTLYDVKTATKNLYNKLEKYENPKGFFIKIFNKLKD